jgi:hypothetical protein
MFGRTLGGEEGKMMRQRSLNDPLKREGVDAIGAEEIGWWWRWWWWTRVVLVGE